MNHTNCTKYVRIGTVLYSFVRFPTVSYTISYVCFFFPYGQVTVNLYRFCCWCPIAKVIKIFCQCMGHAIAELVWELYILLILRAILYFFTWGCSIFVTTLLRFRESTHRKHFDCRSSLCLVYGRCPRLLPVSWWSSPLPLDLTPLRPPLSSVLSSPLDGVTPVAVHQVAARPISLNKYLIMPIPARVK